MQDNFESDSQTVGTVVCGSGYFGGLYCGEIVGLNSLVTGVGGVIYSGYVLVKKTKQNTLSLGGDSGGPWFVYNQGGAIITAVGITTAGNEQTGINAEALYMPIDRIDDHNTSVRLSVGTP